MVRFCILLAAAASFSGVLRLAQPAPATAPTLDQMATSKVHDLQASVTVVQADQTQLLKINKDFGFAYRLRDVTMRYKRPDKLRMEGRIGDTPAQYIVNGPTRFYAIPRLHLRKKDNLGDSPGKRYSLLDVGIVAQCDVDKTEARYLRDETLNGEPTHVFEVTFRGDDTLKYVLWIAPRTHVVLQRQWFDGEGTLRATFRYEDVEQIQPGIWLPLRIEVVNGEGTVAGVTQYANVKVNQGLPDSEFTIS